MEIKTLKESNERNVLPVQVTFSADEANLLVLFLGQTSHPFWEDSLFDISTKCNTIQLIDILYAGLYREGYKGAKVETGRHTFFKGGR